MREMKDSGIEWIGQIPKHWEVHPVYAYFEEGKTKNYRMQEQNLLSLSYGRIIRKDINTNGGLLPASFNTYNVVEAGDIIIRPTDLQNDKRSLRTGLVKEQGIITSAYIDLRPKDNVNSKYYHYLLHSYDVIKVFYNMGNGVRQGLNFSEFAKLLLLEPTTVEQQQIADYLDTQCSEIDATAEDIQKEISLLEDYKKSVITEAVTKGLNPDAEMKDSGIEWIGEIPKGWKIIRLKYITNSIGDGLHGTPNYDDLGTIFFINGNNLGNRKISITEKTNRLTEKEYKKCGVLKLDKRTLLMSLNGTYGTLSMYDNEPIMLSKSVGYINVCNKETKEYLYYFLQSPLAQSQMKISLAGTTIANLSLATVRNLKICLPSICEQQQIADFLDTKCSEIDAIIADKKRQLDILADYKKSLIYEYVTGKKEVPVHE